MHSGGTAKAEPIEVTDTSFARQVLESPLPVLLDCWTPWCGPCLVMAPVLEELATRLSDSVKVAKPNVDENPDTVARLGIQSIPTLFLFKDGQVAGQMVGAVPRAQLEAAILRRLREQ